MHRTYVRRRAVAAGLFLLVLGAGIPAAASAVDGDAGATPAVRYVVRPGDTLWAIAQAHAGGTDPRTVIAAVEDANDVDAAALTPGRVLVIPAA